jgi:hypothetical protein
MHTLTSRVFPVAVAVLVCLAGLVAQAAMVTESGALFDVTYNDNGLVWQTGTEWDPETMMEEPVYEQIGGYTITGPNTIRYFLPPEDMHYIDEWTYEMIEGGQVEVGGYPFSTDSSSASDNFQIIPTAGAPIQGITMTVHGNYSNPVDDATILYTELITAGGDTGGLGFSLGIFSAGNFPTGSTANFAGTTSPIDVDFDVTLDATSSNRWETSFAQIRSIEFTVHRVPEPGSLMVALVGAALLGASRRRKR